MSVSGDHITLTWKGLSASVKDKVLVDDSTGYAKSGQMLAIMGPSGAGKTTLLSLLTGKKPTGVKVEGQVRASGAPYESKQFYSFGNFVFQNDILFETMTVRECIQFSAKLRLEGDMKYKSRKVDELIQDLQLQKCQNTAIGGKFVQGVSGGEKRRVCIALEVITNPSVLVLDEPTSGLDSFTASILLQILLKMAKKGKTIILTIHQPSAKLYNMLDRLILLHKGQTIYQGQANQITTYLNVLQVFPPQNFNISDFFMLQISQYKAKMQSKESNFNAKNYELTAHPAILETIDKLETDFDNVGFQEKEPVCSFFTQVQIIMKRSITELIRHPMKIKGQFLSTIFTVLILGFIFLDAAGNRPPNNSRDTLFLAYMFNLQGVCFTTVVSITMGNLFSSIMTFVVEKQIYLKEEASKYYSPLAYYIARNIVELPSAIIFPLISSTCLFFMLGFTRTFEGFCWFNLTIIAMGLTGKGLGVFMGTIFQNQKQASAMSNLFLIPLMMFGGIYTRFNSFPIYISWMQYISPFKYGFSAVIYSELEGVTFNAINSQGMQILIDPLAQLGITTPTSASIGILLGIALGFYVIGFFCLRLLSSKINA